MRISKISPTIKDQLDRVTPSKDSLMEYRPCQVTLVNGTNLENVYISEVSSYLKVWAIMPEDDSNKMFINVDAVIEVKESPNRLPANLATKLYKAGESGMGYTIFTILFKNGRRFPTYTGNAIDFIKLPNDLKKEDIVDVLPHKGRNDNPQPGPSYYWCLFEK